MIRPDGTYVIHNQWRISSRLQRDSGDWSAVGCLILYGAKVLPPSATALMSIWLPHAERCWRACR